MQAISPAAVILSIKGYIANLEDVQQTNPEPLFSWNRKQMKRTIMWGSSAIRNVNQGFWATELAAYKNGEAIHSYPGAHVRTYAGTFSQDRVAKTWVKIHQRHIFRQEDITETQEDVRRFLENMCDADSVIYHGGHRIESGVAKLLNVPSVFIGHRGLKTPEDADYEKQENEYCKVHQHSLVHCPKAIVRYYINHVHLWYSTNDFPEIPQTGWDEDSPAQPKEASTDTDEFSVWAPRSQKKNPFLDDEETMDME